MWNAPYVLRDYGFDSVNLWTGTKNSYSIQGLYTEREKKTKHCKIKPCHMPNLEWIGFYISEAWKTLHLEIHERFQEKTKTYFSMNVLNCSWNLSEMMELCYFHLVSLTKWQTSSYLAERLPSIWFFWVNQNKIYNSA